MWSKSMHFWDPGWKLHMFKFTQNTVALPTPQPSVRYMHKPLLGATGLVQALNVKCIVWKMLLLLPLWTKVGPDYVSCFNLYPSGMPIGKEEEEINYRPLTGSKFYLGASPCVTYENRKLKHKHKSWMIKILDQVKVHSLGQIFPRLGSLQRCECAHVLAHRGTADSLVVRNRYLASAVYTRTCTLDAGWLKNVTNFGQSCRDLPQRSQQTP